ncbi:triple QxxK/R motif-containing protein isoform X4 [Hemicordylus capensis]|uniref:triple QxxK/R motif-containing protein isoform X4 n=1 Tax=Hemicordylus capensis TaxID=884348 RepID=UPI002302F44D|nr:triple QxxK/R motif-containing protein isoform X4 [Hemicordylus capensis]
MGETQNLRATFRRLWQEEEGRKVLILRRISLVVVRSQLKIKVSWIRKMGRKDASTAKTPVDQYRKQIVRIGLQSETTWLACCSLEA